jgi:hypothetical protein
MVTVKQPWDITQAFAEQLMQQAQQTNQTATQTELMPIQQAMAMDRLKKQGELELQLLPRRLSIEDQIAQLREGRAEGREVGREKRAEGREVGREGREEARGKRTDVRRFGQQKELLGDQTEQAIKRDIGIRRGRMDILKENPNDPIAREIATGHAPDRSSVRQTTPPIPPNWEWDNWVYKPELGGDLSESFNNDLNWRDKYEVGDPQVFGGKTVMPYRRKGSRGRETAAGSVRNPSTLPMGDTGAKAGPKRPVFTDPNTPGLTPTTPAEPAKPGKGDKVSGLLDALKQNGYSDEEAKKVVAQVMQPTSDPDIFDVLVG